MMSTSTARKLAGELVTIDIWRMSPALAAKLSREFPATEWSAEGWTVIAQARAVFMPQPAIDRPSRPDHIPSLIAQYPHYSHMRRGVEETFDHFQKQPLTIRWNTIVDGPDANAVLDRLGRMIARLDRSADRVAPC